MQEARTKAQRLHFRELGKSCLYSFCDGISLCLLLAVYF